MPHAAMLMKFTDKTKEERCSLKEEKEREREIAFQTSKKGCIFKKKMSEHEETQTRTDVPRQ